MKNLATGSLLTVVLLAGCATPELATRTPRPDEDTFGRAHQERLSLSETRPAQNVEVQVEIFSVPEGDVAPFAALWSSVDETIFGAGVRDAYLKNGLRIGAGSAKFAAGLAAAQREKNAGRTSLAVTAANERVMNIPIGKPRMEPTRLTVWNPAAVTRSLTLSRAQLQLQITPTVLDERRVRMEILPRVTYAEESPKMLILPELTASVILQDGMPIVLGVNLTEANTVGSGFLHTGDGASASMFWIVITPHRR